MFKHSKITLGSRNAPLLAYRRNAAALALFFLSALTSAAQTNVLTHHYDNSRTGQNTNETTLTLSNVNTSQFGKLFSQPVDGYVYAQPLYVPNLAIPGKGTHNVLFVATEGDSVYAFDADSNTGSNASPLWMASLIDTAHGAAVGSTTVDSSSDIGCGDLIPQIGITSTPVIDLVSGTMYVEVKSKENGTFVHRLHALDIATGSEKSPGPVVINATVKGRGDGSTNGSLPFDSLHQLNRPGLLLVNGNIYIAYASHCDIGPYHGWVFAYDAATLSQKGVFVSTPDGGLGGFWLSGSGLAADTNGNIFAVTGNGTFDAAHIPATQFGDTILKLALSGGKLSMVDYFTPFNQGTLNRFDTDLGSGGVVLLPDQPGSHPHLLIQAGKEGRIYLLDRDQLTAGDLHFCTTCNTGGKDTQIVQELPSALGGMWSMPAYWNGSVYFWGSGDVLKSYSLSNGMLSASPSSTSTDSYGFPGATPAISANGAGDGIVWSLKTDAYTSLGSAVLRAHDASNVARMLYSSDQNSSRDDPGGAVKFSVPTVINGKVYVGAVGQVSVYGLVAAPTAPDFTISATPASQTVVQGNSTTYTATITAVNGFSDVVTFSASGLPAGATASFSPATVTGSGSSTMTVTTTSTTTTGTFTLTITGTSGATVHSTTVTLVVNSSTPADFSISATPASLTVARGSRGSYTVTVTALNGFAGTVTLSVSGLGTGTQSRFSSTTVTGSGTSTLTVGPSSTAATGTFTLTITGTSGTLVHTTTVTLVVN